MSHELFLILGIMNIFDGIGKQKLILSLVGVALIGCCITILIPKKTGRNKTGQEVYILLFGIEIKSDSDTYARLKKQVKNYDLYYDRNIIVAGSSHEGIV